ncbi:MAG: T9SS type A sorting domain-containing protein [Ignavibacteriae bacterium]|nr:T9SS type A sorting domain-containing protein [Ignavibacteriota bacterium]
MTNNPKTGKIFILIAALLIFISAGDAFSQQYWQKIGNVINRDLIKCSFVDTLNGWAIGDSGTIIRTTNGGYNWTLQNSKIHAYMSAIYFLNQRLGWAIGWGIGPEYYGSYILKTTNGGNTWDTSRYSVPDSYIRTIFFQDSLYGFMGGNPALFLRTTNGGAVWERCAMDSSVVAGFPVNRFRFFSRDYGIACGGIMDIAGVIWKTTNRGLYWTVQPIAPEPINDIKFLDSLNIFVIAGDYEYGTSVMRSSNGGQNWDYTNIGVFGIPGTMAFRTFSEAWCPMGYFPSFLMTNNLGYSWYQIDTPDSSKIMDLAFVNQRFGIGVGINGAVVRYNPNVTFTVSGNVRYQDNNQPVTAGKVKAFKINKTTYQVVYVDSAVIQPNGTYTLTHVPQDSVDIGVFPNSTPPNDWVITYYPSTINWQNAAVIYPSQNMDSVDISVFRLVNTVANNSVNGKVMQSSFALLPGIKDAFIYVKNGNAFVKSGITDSAGVYHLQSLPSGSLKVIVNRIGYSGDSSVITMTPTSNLDSVNFYLSRISVNIKKDENINPSDFMLYQNYPNPFNPSTNIKFRIKEPRFVTLKIYDILGREAAVLLNEKLNAGEYTLRFDAPHLPSGLYLCRLTAGDFSETKKIVLVK